MVELRQSGCILANMVVIGQNSLFWKKWLFSGKVVVLGSGGCIRVRLLYLGKKVVFEQSGCLRAK